MEVTEVRIKLMDDPQDRLQAFCSITIDSSFVIRDLKIIQGAKGSFVAMPSRKLTDRCPRCHTKNHLRAHYCNQCGANLNEDRAIKDGEGRAKLYADIAHPINSECRDTIQQIVLENFEEEQIRAREPNYVCRYDDYGEERYATLYGGNEMEPEGVGISPAVAAGFPGHRFEQSDSGYPRPPHHSNGERIEKSYADTARTDNTAERVPHRSEEGEDSFGAGIL